MYFREVDGVYEVCVGTDRKTDIRRQFDDVDAVIHFLTSTRQRYLEEGWTDVTPIAH
jgi:hypothetical protein